MVRMFSKFALPAIALLAVAMFAPQAKAQQDFACSGTTSCAGTITVGGGNYSTTSITLTSSSPWILPVGDGDEAGETFTLAFNTGASTISMTDASDADASFSGTILSFSCKNQLNAACGSPKDTQDTLTLFVNWNIPGYHSGVGTVAFVIKNNAAFSVDVSVLPTPEPASLLLLGTGLLGMGAMVRRRWIG